MVKLSASEAADLLRRLAPHVKDDAVIEYLAAAVLEADSKEDVSECCETWLGDEADQGVDEICKALGLNGSDAKAAGAAPLSNVASGGYPTKLAAPVVAAAPVTMAAAVEAEEPRQESSGSDDAKPSSKAASKAASKATSRAAKQAAKQVAKKATKARQPSKESPAGPPTSSFPDELVEITSQVSRFHKEAVEDEMTSAISEVDIHGICMSVAGRELLVDTHLKLCAGQRYGFVGRNGCGKSTLFRSMAKRRIPGYPPNCITLLVDQEDVGDDRTAVDTVVSASKELEDLLEEQRSLAASEEGTADAAARALRAHELFLARAARFKAAMYESKLSGQRGKAARDALLEAEHRERDAEEAMSKEITAAEATEEAQVKASTMLADVRDRLETLGADVMRGQAEVLLKGLGFNGERLKMPTKLLSGGWRMRAALAKAMLAKPDVLLLDEPTNHLDWHAILWLERYLVSTDLEDSALVVVSHDRDFLDKVTTKTLRLFEKQLQLHDGNYSTFEEAHAKDQQHRTELAARSQAKHDKMAQQIQQMESKGRQTGNDSLLKAVASRRTKLGMDGKPWSFDRVGLERAGGHKWKSSYGQVAEAMSEMEVENKEAAVKLKLQAAAELGFEAALLQCRDVVVGYDKAKPLVRKFDLDVRAKSRIGILGVNGSGKTTLLRTLVQELPALAGEVYQQPRVVVGFFDQHQADSLPNDATALQAVCESRPDVPEGEIRAHLGSFGLGRLCVQPIRCLSGGERSRVALARAVLRPPHVLVLDEPTNHLDLQTVEALGKALQDFAGSVIITSHDRRLLRDVCTDFYVVQGQKLAKKDLDAFVRSVR